jgi:hypothetical protein
MFKERWIRLLFFVLISFFYVYRQFGVAVGVAWIHHCFSSEFRDRGLNFSAYFVEERNCLSSDLVHVVVLVCGETSNKVDTLPQAPGNPRST